MKYIFISYLNRSGSTYLANMLSRSPKICVCPEAEILYTLFLTHPTAIQDNCRLKNSLRILENNRKFQLWNISVSPLIHENKPNLEIFFNILQSFQQQYYPEAEYIVFKHNYLLNLAENYFKDNTVFFISVLRNPLGVFASQKITISPTTGRSMCKNALSFTDTWNQYILKVNQLKNNSLSLVIKYEELISDTNSLMDKIFGFIGYKQSWDIIKKNQSELSKWILQEYKSMHRNINSEALPEINEKWRNIITKKELMVLKKYLIPANFYATDFESADKLYFWFYEINLKVGRRLAYIRGQIQKKRLKKMLNKPC